MKKTVKISSRISMIMGIIAMAWLVYNAVVLVIARPLIVNLEPVDSLEPFVGIVWIGFLFFFFYHISAALTLAFQFRFFKKADVTSILALCLGILSSLAVFGDWAILGDIGKEYDMGWDTSGEWPILYIFQGIHFLFFCSMIALLMRIFRDLKSTDEQVPAKKDEIIFSIANCVGIVCGLLGLAWTFMILGLDLPFRKLGWNFISTIILILLPYGLIVIYWLIVKLREHSDEIYDEKQGKDVRRAGFTTLLFSIPCLLVFFIIFSLNQESESARIMWMPFYLFTILMIFSVSTLIYYRRN